MRRVLLVQPSLQPPGGGNGVAAWMLQALVKEHRVTVLSWRPVAVDPVNRFFGTTLQPNEFETMLIPRSWTLVPEHVPVPAALLRSALLMRYTRRVSHSFEVIIGAHNEMDFGRRGIQYVHYPTFLRPRPAVDYRWYHRWAPMLDGYYRIADTIGGFSFDRIRQNLTLTNSDWTAERVKSMLGIDARTLYPPVVDGGAQRRWEERQTAFLAVGRVAPEKQWERCMRILSRVRSHVPNLRLTIIGTWDRHSWRYKQSLERLAASLGPWIEFQQNLPRDGVRGLMASHRYGIHGMREEHFGMAPAEMIGAGMIVWVPRGGGQTEIIGEESSLLYDNEDEAAEKILRVLSETAEQRRLRAHLETQSARFGTDRFENEVRAIVSAFRE